MVATFLVNLPIIRLEFARRSFDFLGARLYNFLRLDVRKETSFLRLKNKRILGMLISVVTVSIYTSSFLICSTHVYSSIYF